MRLLIILLIASLSGCSEFECGDAGVLKTTGFLGRNVICNGEEFNTTTQKWGWRTYTCGMWSSTATTELTCVDKKSDMYNMTFKEADAKGLIGWRY